MTTYEITYDYCRTEEYDGEYFSVDERNIRETFMGSWDALQEHLKDMKESGCYNISASAYCDEYEDEYEAW